MAVARDAASTAEGERTRAGVLAKTAPTMAAILALAMPSSPAHAACPQELAVYAEREGSAGIDFRPTAPGAAVKTAQFRIVFAQNGVVLDGFAVQSAEVPRPYGMVTHDCPEGDVTGEEIAACTVWEGVIYAIDAEGRIGLLPAQGMPAAEQLLFPDFGPALRHSAAYGPDGVSLVPWDVFQLSGCQE